MVLGYVIDSSIKGIQVIHCDNYVMNKNDYIILKPDKDKSTETKTTGSLACVDYPFAGTLPLVFQSKKACIKYFDDYKEKYGMPEDFGLEGVQLKGLDTTWEHKNVYYIAKVPVLKTLVNNIKGVLKWLMGV